VDQGCIPPLCDLLTVMDSKIVAVALNGLENILRLGDQQAKASNGTNPYAVLIEECYGMTFFLIIKWDWKLFYIDIAIYGSGTGPLFGLTE